MQHRVWIPPGLILQQCCAQKTAQEWSIQEEFEARLVLGGKDFSLEVQASSWQKRKKKNDGYNAKGAIFKALLICVKENCCCNHRYG